MNSIKNVWSTISHGILSQVLIDLQTHQISSDNTYLGEYMVKFQCVMLVHKVIHITPTTTPFV